MAAATNTPRPQEDFTKTKPQDTLSNKAGQVADKAKETTANVADRAREVASSVADRAKDVASNVADKTKEMASSLGHKAEDATHALGSGMQAFGGTVREKLPHGGVVGSAASSFANTLESGGQYLKEEGLSGMAEDVTNMIRRILCPQCSWASLWDSFSHAPPHGANLMATDLNAAHDTHEASVTELVSGIINDAQTLFKQQIEMLKHEVKEDMRKAREASMMLGLGAGIGGVGAILLAHMLSLWTNWAFPNVPLWGCYGIWGAVTLVIGAGLLFAGKSKLDTVNPLEDEAAKTVKENVQWITNPK